MGKAQPVLAVGALDKQPAQLVEGEVIDPPSIGVLTMQQQMFLDAYLSECRGNGTQAYMLAYPNASAESARREACRLLTKPHIRAVLQDRMHEAGINQVELLSRIRAIAMGDQSGALKRFALSRGTDMAALADIDPTLISRIRVQEGKIDSFEIELHDPIPMLQLAAKIEGLLQPDLTINIEQAKLFVAVDIDRV